MRIESRVNGAWSFEWSLMDWVMFSAILFLGAPLVKMAYAAIMNLF